MGIEKNETTKKRAEIEILCLQNHEAFLRIEFILGEGRPLETLSTRDYLFVVGLQIERLNRGIDELEAILRNDGQPRNEEGTT